MNDFPFALPLVAGPTATATAPPPPPDGPVDNNGGAGAGSYGFLVIIALIVLSIILFIAMNRSLRHARRNLGGDTLPRRRRAAQQRHVIPVRDEGPAHEDDSTRDDGAPSTRDGS